MPTSPGRRVWAAALAALSCAGISGCAALTNPVANGVPVRILPEELLAESREGFELLPLMLLRQPPPEQYVLATGDTLGIYVEGILGDVETPPPVNIPPTPDLPPSIGYPFPIREDGTISLPYVEPVPVAGLTIEEAETAVIEAYLQREIIRPEDRRILVTLMRPRYIRVLVIRDDTAERQLTVQTDTLFGIGAGRTQIGGGRVGEGMVLELPAYQNDVLNAITRSGGLPGPLSTQEIIVQRGPRDGEPHPADADQFPPVLHAPARGGAGRSEIRIPMMVRPGERLPFRPEDVILETGDIVMVRARKPELYYTGGLLPPAEHLLPIEYDLTVVEAVLRARGSLISGGTTTNNISGFVVQAGLGNPSPSQLTVLRPTRSRGQVVIRVDLNQAARDPRENLLVQAGDVLILQESPEEAITRYFTQVFQMDLFFRWLNRGDAQGTGSLIIP